MNNERGIIPLVPKWRMGSAAAQVTCAAVKGDRVAHMITGNARTLYDPRAYHTLQTNFIEAFGGRYNTFLYLKLSDDVLANVKKRYSSSISEDKLADALKVLAPTDYVITAQNKNVRNPNCSLVGFRPDLIRLVAQLHTLRECFRLVQKFEESNRMKFDWITRLRPDTVIAYPIKPYCFFDRQYTYLPATPPIQRDLSKFEDVHYYIDHAAILPRVQAPGLVQAFDEYAKCRGNLEWRYKRPGPRGERITDIQAFLFWTNPGRNFKIRSADIPVVLFREDKEVMREMCENQYNGKNGNWMVFTALGPELCKSFLVTEVNRKVALS